jgi:hypothetical protein
VDIETKGYKRLKKTQMKFVILLAGYSLLGHTEIRAI